MIKKISLFFCVLVLTFQGFSQETISLKSPNSHIVVEFKLDTDRNPVYQLKYKNKQVVFWSSLGLQTENVQLVNDFVIENVSRNTIDETWSPVLGQFKNIRNHANEIKIQLKQITSDIQMILYFRVFNEGLAFRYALPSQKNVHHFVLTDELSTFNLQKNYKAFWIPGDYDSQEYVYEETQLSDINTGIVNLNNGIGMKGPLSAHRVQSPLMLKGNGLYVNIFEAALINYPVMHLDVDTKKFKIKSHLTPSVTGAKAYLQTPFISPWRTVMVSDDARDILASQMILNLNDPSKLEDTSWIKPTKYVGIWWEMHVGKSTWDYAGSQSAQAIPSGKHGATTTNAKRYIDFAAQHGFDAVLIEGWNTGWEDWFGNWKEEVFDFVTPYPDFSIEEVTNYAKTKGIALIMHHETSGSVTNYERRLDRAFQFMKKHNYHAVKTGYVGRIIPRGEWHDGQWMVNHFNYVLERAAAYKIMVNSHESVRPTGTHRTYPNFVSAEAARGNEFNAWSIGNPPNHETILPFTRLLGGPMDYTPGIFETQMSAYEVGKKEAVKTTLAKQLALYVTMYSPLQMAADLPENYEKYMDAFQFIKDVALDWQLTRILEAEPGDFVTIARKDKHSEQWFLGAITDENARTTEISLSFLSPKQKYQATIYEDATDAHFLNNPKAYQIKTIMVTNKSKLKLNLAPGGGTAIHFKPMN